MSDNPQDPFEHDVALSFLYQDEALAVQIADLLQDRFKIFIYSKAQEAIAGTDGLETFSRVFGDQARTVAVLYRPEWGTTQWTRIEETAIKNRTLRDGYDFATFIMLDDSIRPPKWMPKTQLFYSLPKYGIKGAAGALALRIQNQGGEAVVETVSARAQRLKRAHDFEDAKNAFARSFEGVKAGTEANREFVQGLKCAASEINANGVICRFQEVRDGEHTLLVGKGVVLLTWWTHYAANDLDEAKLTVDFYDGVPNLPGVMAWDKPNRLERREFGFGLAGPNRPAWLAKDGKDCSSAHLVELMLKRFMDLQEKALKQRR